MFDSSVLDVAIGLVFVYLLLSLAASSAREGLEAFLKQRAQDLYRGIKELLGDDTETQKFVTDLYNHGTINALYSGKFNYAKPRNLPSYIPSRSFTLAILSLWHQYEEQQINPVPPELAIKLPVNVKSAFKTFEIAVKRGDARIEKLVEDWYNSAMDRVSGKYKRHTQNWLFVIGLVLSITVNADTIQIAQRLSTDKTLRSAVVQASQDETRNEEIQNQVNEAVKRTQTTPTPPATAQPAPATAQTTAAPATATEPHNPSVHEAVGKIKDNLSGLDGVGLPLGWSLEYQAWKDNQNRAAHQKQAQSGVQPALPTPATQPADDTSTLSDYLRFFFLYATPRHIPGWLLTSLALSLGAPFWFDTLNKFMVVRSTVKPNEKSGEEKSKDGNSSPASTAAALMEAVPAAAASAAAAAQAATPPAAATTILDPSLVVVQTPNPPPAPQP